MSEQDARQQSRSDVQQKAEEEIRKAFQKELAEKCNIEVDLEIDLKKDDKKPPKAIQESGIQLDGFSDDPKLLEPILIEIWAHQGKTKPGQRNKVMKDMCKLLLAEELLDKPCQKYIVVSDEEVLSFLNGRSWMGDFAKKFGIKFWIANIKPATRKNLNNAQTNQGDKFSS